MARALTSLLMFICCFSAAYGQDLTPFERSQYSPASYYNYSEPADVTILVNVWGTLRNPGLYEVAEGTSLSHLLSLAGGPIVSARDSRDDRTIYVRLYRDEAGRRQLVYETRMLNEMNAVEDDPLLYKGDVVTVETEMKQGFTWQDVFPVIAAVASVALAVERISSP